ncbi:hypothetical protein SAMN05421753_10582 [Planctomicrobium piriforme]|uniref:Uncharacterized protein n=1 Tax=Planctomicrobium piriforme TaxID=1576369 RepID=A0A1I3F4M1_9PLAN|nr:hypothetical protein SAMN05421753_10582 [Planctomicrobium piriforme]
MRIGRSPGEQRPFFVKSGYSLRMPGAEENKSHGELMLKIATTGQGLPQEPGDFSLLGRTRIYVCVREADLDPFDALI